jgi:acetolactate synthase-1/2/3 large subunit
VDDSLPLNTVADYAVALVTALGSDTAFCLTGGMAMHLNRAVAEQPGLRAIYCQHEQAAVAAAEGYAKASDFRRAGFAVVTAGPGVSNSVTALLSANGDSTPLIVLAGQIKTEDINPFGVRTHGNQEIPSQALITPCVKHFARLGFDDFRASLIAAIVQALEGRPGVAFIEIPLDVQGSRTNLGHADVEADAKAVLEIVDRRCDGTGASDLATAFERLLASPRPLLYVGNGCRIAGVAAEVRQFIEATGCPSVFSWLSFDILPGEHPQHFGCPGGFAPISANRILGGASDILFLGARLDLGTTAFQRDDFGGQATRTFVDVDAKELSKFGCSGRSLRLQADLRVLRQMTLPTDRVDPAWSAWCERERSEGQREEVRRLGNDRLSLYHIAGALSAQTAGKVVVPASSGYAEETLTRFFRPAPESRFFNGASLGAMGVGLPMAIGAALGSPRRVFCVDADGGVMLNIQELSTLKTLNTPGFVLFILNNDGYEAIRSSQQRHFGAVFGADPESGLFIPDFAALSAAFQLKHVRIASQADLAGFLDAYGEDDPPVVAELVIERSEPRGPGVKTVIQPDGRPVTTPLAEIDW